MDRCLIVFDLDTKALENSYHNASWQNGYADIKRILNKHGFTNIQGTVYLSEQGIRQAHGTLAIQEVAARYRWFYQCVSNIKFYDLADDFNAHFIIESVEQARLVFERRIEALRQQLVDAGVEPAKIEQIVGKQTFSLEEMNAPQALPHNSK